MNEVSGREAPPNFELPQQPAGPEQQREQAIEATPAVESKTGRQAQPASASPPVITPLPDIPAANAPSIQAADSVANSTTAMGVVDEEKIEKQYVAKAKTIVAGTHDDPHRQTEEIGKLKVDFQKQVFNRVPKAEH